MDQRDGLTWVVLELTRAGEQSVEDGTLDISLREALGVDQTHPVFIPSAVYLRGGKRVAVHLMEGYAFVASGLPDTQYFALEHVCPQVKQVLSYSSEEGGLRTLSTLGDPKIADLRQQLRQHVSTDLDIGMQTTITEGGYKNLEAEVMYLDADDAVVCIELRSIKIITRLPRFFLEPSSEHDDG